MKFPCVTSIYTMTLQKQTYFYSENSPGPLEGQSTLLMHIVFYIWNDMERIIYICVISTSKIKNNVFDKLIHVLLYLQK